jgi:hypothetical protein
LPDFFSFNGQYNTSCTGNPPPFQSRTEIVAPAVGQGFDLAGASHPRQVAFIESVEPRDLGDDQAMLIAAEKLS